MKFESFKDLIPGYCSGMVRVLISHPFDYIRLYLQMNRSNTFKEFFQEIPITKLYKGVKIPLMIVPIDRSIQFKSYEYLNKLQFNPFVSGALCGIISTLFTLPSNYLINKYLLDKHRTIMDILKNDYSNMYKGFRPEIIRSILGSGIYLGVYGSMRNRYPPNDTIQSIINSSFAGIAVWTITYPLDTLKVEQQIHHYTIEEIYTKRIKIKGFFNLWKGILPIYIRSIPSSSAGMLVYETVRKYTQDEEELKNEIK